MPSIVEQLRDTCRQLLADGTVNVIIGYGQAASDGATFPVFITKPEDVGQLVWNAECYYNLTTYLKRPDVQALGKIGLVVKGCDERTLIVLEKESQIERPAIHVIGVACQGVGSPTAAKCSVCEVHRPRFADVVIGEATNEPVPVERRYAQLLEHLKLTQPERVAYWMTELSRCVKCYACRQVCPLCYCKRCIVDKNRPQTINPSPTLEGNFAYHIMRAFHMAARCIECEECTRVCPAGINLHLLNQSLSRAAEAHFGYRAGMDPAAEPPVGGYSTKDQEEFIR